MSYEKQNFIKGQTLKADHLNYMEDGISQLSEEVEELKENGTADDGSVTPEQIQQAVDAYLAAHPVTETDPTVPDWAKQPGKPTYTAQEVGALPADAEIVDQTARQGVQDNAEAIGQLSEEIEELKDDGETIKQSGVVVSLDCAEGTKIKVSGDTAGTVTLVNHGKNFLPSYTGAAVSDSDGLSYSANDDGTLHIAGTPTKTKYIVLCSTPSPLYLPAGDYYLHSNLSGVSNVQLQLKSIEDSTTHALTGTKPSRQVNLSAPGTFTVMFIVMAGTIDERDIYIQLEKIEGGTYTDYEKYVGKVYADVSLPTTVTAHSGANIIYTTTGDTITASYKESADINEIAVEIIDKKFAEKEDDSVPLKRIVTDGGLCKIFKTIGVCGDSLASGLMAYADAEDETTESYAHMYDYSWIQYMARYCGSTAHNFSRGGMTTRSFFGDKATYGYNKLTNAEKLCQAYFIALGHNDKNIGMEVGSVSDVNVNDSSQNADTYYGNYAKIISSIKAVQPYAKIFCVCMKSDKSYGAYNAAIREIVPLFSNVYLLDMAAYAPALESWEYTQGHGNAMGYLNYSYQIASYVDWIIRHNPDDFKYVHFIGTEYQQHIPSA